MSGPIGVDAELCRGCQACQLACSLYHEGQCRLALCPVGALALAGPQDGGDD